MNNNTLNATEEKVLSMLEYQNWRNENGEGCRLPAKIE